MKGIIVIPARYASKRLPGKPLLLLGGKPIFQRVYEVAQAAVRDYPNVTVVLATDSQEIAQAAASLGIPYVMTPESCNTGSDRVAAATADDEYDFIINFQGDAPLTPPYILTQMITAFEDPKVEVVTPVVPLTWEALAQLRKNKEKSPFSGTTAIIDPRNSSAIWFSKNIIPAIRKEDHSLPLSPVFKHIGIYGYRQKTLKNYLTLSQSHYEQIEELEQLRFLENGIPIHCCQVDYKNYPLHGGIDTMYDLENAQEVLALHGAPESWV